MSVCPHPTASGFNQGSQIGTVFQDWHGSGWHSWNTSLIMPSLHGVPLCCFVTEDTICHGTLHHDSCLATKVVAHFNVGGGLSHRSTESFVNHLMKWHCSLKPQLTNLKKNLQRSGKHFFPSIASAVLLPYCHICPTAKKACHPRYQISPFPSGNLWLMSVTLDTVRCCLNFS